MAKRKNIKHNCFDCGIEILIDSDQLRKENNKTGYHCRYSREIGRASCRERV